MTPTNNSNQTEPARVRLTLEMAFPQSGGLSRRQFLQAGATVGLGVAACGLAGAGTASAAGTGRETAVPDMRFGSRELVVQPVLMYSIPQKQPARSWRPWTGLQSEETVNQEVDRIGRELKELARSADFPVRILPVAKVTKAPEAAALKDTPFDALLLYAAGAWLDEINTLAGLGKWVIVFVRYRSGPYYYWHEGIHDRFLRAHTDQFKQPAVGVEDVVVDDPGEVRWRLQALYGLKNVLGRRIVCVGGPSGWECPKAPALARERFQLDMVTVPIPEVNAMVEAGRKDESLMARCQQEARAYLSARGVKLVTTERAVTEAFLLKKLYGDLMARSEAVAITSAGCMNSYAGIMPCLTHTLINDDGRMAYCEGDFVNIPSGILLHYICGKPTYFCNPTMPAKGRMLFAHCTAPRRMNGKTLEPAQIVTHYESDHGAATHVSLRKGQLLTILKPDFEARHWLALTGRIIDTPVLDTCRAQVEVALDAETQDVARNLRGFHCMLAYGDYVREVVYAAGKVGIQVQTLPKARA
jgi:hypothetical protein